MYTYAPGKTPTAISTKRNQHRYNYRHLHRKIFHHLSVQLHQSTPPNAHLISLDSCLQVESDQERK